MILLRPGDQVNIVSCMLFTERGAGFALGGDHFKVKTGDVATVLYAEPRPTSQRGGTRVMVIISGVVGWSWDHMMHAVCQC